MLPPKAKPVPVHHGTRSFETASIEGHHRSSIASAKFLWTRWAKRSSALPSSIALVDAGPTRLCPSSQHCRVIHLVMEKSASTRSMQQRLLASGKKYGSGFSL